MPNPRRIVDLGGQRKQFGTRATAAPSSAVGLAKARAHKVWRIARGDPKLALLCDRAWSETLTAVEAHGGPGANRGHAHDNRAAFRNPARSARLADGGARAAAAVRISVLAITASGES